MATYAAQAEIILTVNVEAEGEGDPEAIEAAKQDLVTKIAEGSIIYAELGDRVRK
jgi:hypothetical protein